MIRILFFLILLSSYSFGQNIIPQPNLMELKEGNFSLSNDGFIQDKTESFDKAVRFLQIQLLNKFQMTWQKSKTNGEIVFEKNPALAEEEYTLEVNSKGIKISANSNAGALYGVSSLLQLIEKNKVPFVYIKDSPVYAWRGFMLDESRHFFGKEKVEQLLDWMAIYKLNKFHWHLTDEPGWRLEIVRYPYLALIGGIGTMTKPYAKAQYYSQKEIQEIVNYAAARNIEVIPEIDMPGHATAANKAYPQYSGGGTPAHPDFTFHPAKEETYQYLSNVLKEVNILFPSKKLHLGGDEVAFGSEAWNADKQVQELKKTKNLKNNKEVEAYFMRRMADSVYKMGSQLVAWDEMIEAKLPADKTIIMWWRHDKPELLKNSLTQGYKTIICPRIPLYFDFVQEENHKYGRKWDKKFNPLKSVYNFDLSQYNSWQKYDGQILGAQANLWTEKVHNQERFDFMTYPRIAALAEMVWTNPAKKDFNSFYMRLSHHKKWYRQEGIYFYEEGRAEPIAEEPKYKNFDE